MQLAAPSQLNSVPFEFDPIRQRCMAAGLALCAGVAAAALAVPQQASALTIPSQESYGGLGRNTGSAGSSPKSPTRASMEGCEYTAAA
jgi:hypothetical protein